MEQNTNEAPPALPPPALAAEVAVCVDETFAPGCRKPRHDGWTPARIGDFLFGLAACGTVEGAAAEAGMSPQSAYNFRNRRQGRAFAKMWDAVLIHRGRAKVAGDNLARAQAGNVSRRTRDGEVVEELHYHDNRLSMAVLTRLDRLAEKEAPNEEHLRALSEELEEFVEHLEAGGDADAFVEERRPGREQPKPEPEPPAEPLVPLGDRSPPDDFDRLARAVGISDWRDVDPFDIPVEDLDLEQRAEWTADQWVRAGRSGFLIWVECGEDAQARVAPETLAFIRDRALAEVQFRQAQEEESLRVEVGDLHPGGMREWTEDQWDRAERSGLLGALPEYAWPDRDEEPEDEESKDAAGEDVEAPWQASTSSTFSGEPPPPAADEGDEGDDPPPEPPGPRIRTL